MGLKILGEVIMSVRLRFEGESVGRADVTTIGYGGRGGGLSHARMLAQVQRKSLHWRDRPCASGALQSLPRR